jgi:hypothetical protein
VTYGSLLGLTVLLGLATRVRPDAFPALVARYGGDILWASMLVWLLALLRPGSTTTTRGLVAIGIATLVELSQLIQSPWLTAARATPIGALVLGQGFLWSDLVCYAIGVSLASLLDARLSRRLLPAT